MAEINKEDLFSDELLRAPLELADGLEEVYKVINKIKASSEKSEVAIKQASSISAIAKESKVLTDQEKELLKVQKQISVALAKNNDEYIEHKKGLDAINRAVKEKINKGREDVTFTGQMKNAMKDLKNELKEAKNAMLLAADAGGTMSKEYQQAAKQAGEIADKIGDAKDEAKVFANDTSFGALGTRVGLLKDKLFSLDFKGVGEQLKGMGQIILANPILLLIGVLTGIAVAAYKLRDSVGFLKDAFNAAGKAIEYVVQLGKDFLDYVGASNFALEKQNEILRENSKQRQKDLEQGYDREIALASAAGKSTLEIEKKKQQAIALNSTERINSLLLEQQKNGELNEDKKKLLDEEVKAASDAILAIDVLEVKQSEERKKRREEEAAARLKDYEERAKLEDAANIREFDEKRKAQLAIIEAVKNSKDEEFALELEYTEKTESMIELLERRRIESLAKANQATQDQLTFQTGIMNELVALVDATARSNDDTLRTLAKNFLIFTINQIEKQMLAVQAAAIAETTANALKSGLPLPITVTQALIKIGFIKAAFAVARTAIARFAVGTDNAPGGLAYVGEQGSELIKTPDGRLSLSPAHATLTHLPKGSQVIPNDETMALLATSAFRNASYTKSGDFVLYHKIGSLEKAIRETNSRIEDAVERSNGKMFMQGSLVYEAKATADRNKRLIRLKSLSA